MRPLTEIYALIFMIFLLMESIFGRCDLKFLLRLYSPSFLFPSRLAAVVLPPRGKRQWLWMQFRGLLSHFMFRSWNMHSAWVP